MYHYGIKNVYQPMILVPKAYGWERGNSYNSADVPSRWINDNNQVTTDILRQQFAYEWMNSGDQAFARYSNPPFVSGAAGRLHPLLADATGGPARILRGYIRRSEFIAGDDVSRSRLYFMYNPEHITRDYVSYLDQSALDPFNTVYQSGNLVAPPSILNFSFELFFDRQEEAIDASHPGVFVDYQYFDLVVRNVIPQDPKATNNTLPDNGVMMVNPRDITIVFSPQISVQGRPTNARVSFEKFTHRMVPTRMRIQLTILASYFGPPKDMVEYKAEQLPAEESIPITEIKQHWFSISWDQAEAEAQSMQNGPNYGYPGGISPPLGLPSAGSASGINFSDQISQANDANYVIRLQALQWAMNNVVEGTGRGAYEGGGGHTDYTGANSGSGRYALPRGADCSGLVTEAYCRVGHGATMGWSNHPGTASIMSSIKRNVCTYVPLNQVRLSDLMKGDILIKNINGKGHIAFLIEVQGTKCIIFDAAGPNAHPEVGRRSINGTGTFTHLIRPMPFGASSSAARTSGYPGGSVGGGGGGGTAGAWSATALTPAQHRAWNRARARTRRTRVRER